MNKNEKIAEMLNHMGSYYRVAYSVLRNHDDADDAVQKAILYMLKKTDEEWAKIHNVASYVRSCSYSRALDVYRMIHRFDVVALESIEEYEDIIGEIDESFDKADWRLDNLE